MDYKLIGKNDYMINPNDTILKNRHIDDPHFFSKISDKAPIDPVNLKNIDRGAEVLITHCMEGSNILLVVDSDTDGYTSASILMDYISRVYPEIKIQPYFHSGKEHGLKTVEVSDEVNLVIAPDSGSSDFEEHEALYRRGIDCLVIDHHPANEDSRYGVVINPYISENYANKDLAGVGVVYKFLKYLDSILEVNIADKYLDLVMIGTVADMVYTLHPESLYFIEMGQKNFNNNFINALKEKRKHGFKNGITQKSISWYIAPLINATIRVGTQADKAFIFRALSNQLSKPQIKEAVKVCVNNHKVQSTLRSAAVEILERQIQLRELNTQNVLILIAPDSIEKTLLGLAASIIAEKHCKSTIILHEVFPGYFEGSARSYKFDDFKEAVLASNLFTFAEGHSTAFGVGISLDKISEATKHFDSLKQVLRAVEVTEVDFEIPASRITPGLVSNCSQYKKYIGKSFPEIKMVITDVRIESNSLQRFGAKGNVISFKSNGIKYIMFNGKQKDYQILSNNLNMPLKILGVPETNEYKGNSTAQIVIKDYELDLSKKFDF